MEALLLSQSQSATSCSRIFSPSPLKKVSASRIKSSVARELFLESEPVEADPCRSLNESPSNFIRSKLFSLRGESDTSSKSEWSGSDSGCSNTLDLDLDSPRKAAYRNPFNQDQIFDDIAFDVPSRTSNPIANDALFQTSSMRF